MPPVTAPIPHPDQMLRPRSGTHQQILSILASELRKTSPRPGDRLAILDIGCGDGLLIEYLGKALPLLFPGVGFDIYGFDVGDHGVQPDGYFARTADYLARSMPDTDWSARLALISENDPWPYEDGMFAATVSNQVLEHVRDHDLFFAETARVTRTGGVGIHVFPSRHLLIEPHTHVPFAHRCPDPHGSERLIRIWSRLGRGRYAEHKRRHPPITPESYAARHADYLWRYTNFRRHAFFLETAKAHQLHATFRHTGLYITAKIRRMRGRPERHFAPDRRGAGATLASWLGPYLTNSTLLVRKARDYDTEPQAGASA